MELNKLSESLPKFQSLPKDAANVNCLAKIISFQRIAEKWLLLDHLFPTKNDFLLSLKKGRHFKLEFYDATVDSSR